MGVTKYRFNPETLTYEKAQVKLSKKLITVFALFIIVAIFATGFTAFYIFHYDTPETIALRKEKSELLEQYNELNTKLDQIESVLDEIQVRDDNIYRVILESEPIPGSVRKAGFGGTDRYAELESFQDAEIVKNTSKKIDIHYLFQYLNICIFK